MTSTPVVRFMNFCTGTSKADMAINSVRQEFVTSNKENRQTYSLE